MKPEFRQQHSVDELTTALVSGLFEKPLWRSFLELLREATAADHAVLVLQPPGRALDEGLQFADRDVEISEIGRLYRAHFHPQPPVRREWLKDGEVGSLADNVRLRQGGHEQFYRELEGALGVRDTLQLRVSEPHGVDGWLTIVSLQREFGESEAKLLRALATGLRGVVRTHVERERERFAATLASDAVRRLQCGWIVMDKGGYIITANEFGETILTTSGVLARSRNGKLTITPPELEGEVLKIISELAMEPSARAKAISVRNDPCFDMLLVPVRENMLTPTAIPAVIAYVHQDNWRNADRRGQLVDLFGLTPSEARLALALCRGMSLAEAASSLSISESTARGYSKVIYAKTGTRGMADLVRVIMGSVLVLAPDAWRP